MEVVGDSVGGSVVVVVEGFDVVVVLAVDVEGDLVVVVVVEEPGGVPRAYFLSHSSRCSGSYRFLSSSFGLISKEIPKNVNAGFSFFALSTQEVLVSH